MAETFAARLRQVDLVKKADFNNKLTSFNRRITSSNTKHLKVQKKKKKTKYSNKNDYNFFLGRIYFASNDGSQNKFVYQPETDTLELKREIDTGYVLSWKSKRVFNLNRNHYILLS